jgi:hypothetical protein
LVCVLFLMIAHKLVFPLDPHFLAIKWMSVDYTVKEVQDSSTYTDTYVSVSLDLVSRCHTQTIISSQNLPRPLWCLLQPKQLRRRRWWWDARFLFADKRWSCSFRLGVTNDSHLSDQLLTCDELSTSVSSSSRLCRGSTPIWRRRRSSSPSRIRLMIDHMQWLMAISNMSSRTSSHSLTGEFNIWVKRLPNVPEIRLGMS